MDCKIYLLIIHMPRQLNMADIMETNCLLLALYTLHNMG